MWQCHHDQCSSYYCDLVIVSRCSILVVTFSASWRNTVEGDPDGYTFAGIVVVVSFVLLLDIDWRMWLQSVEGYAMK